jgi:nitrate/nitrite transporter NarK
LLALIAAGEAAFFLPFLLPRVFRPTLLEVFDLTNLELGTAFSVYGVVAMIAYICGGPLADRFGARRMLATALVSTSAGGIALLGIPGINTLILLYAYWGITTIALFWAPLIKATRDWGGHEAQGSAFGLLDGGRGLFGALTASLLVAVFALLLPTDPETATTPERAAALRQVIGILFAFTAGSAVLLWVLLPADNATAANRNSKLNLHGLMRVGTMPTVWLQALIILCAYVAFRGVDDFSLYANEVIGANQVEAAALGTTSLWVRPIAAVAAGFLADRFGAGRMTVLSFAIVALGSLLLGTGLLGEGHYTAFLLVIVCTSLGIFALRGLYFAIMREGRVPLAFTGAAVGLVSLVGYTPDVFMGPLMGYLLDSSPGALGHQHVFRVVTGFALAGLITAAVFQRLATNVDGSDNSDESKV